MTPDPFIERPASGLRPPATAQLPLVWPSSLNLPSYVAALETGWSADNVRGAVAAREERGKINADAVAFIESMVDREAKGPPVTLPNGCVVSCIPGYPRWSWDGEVSARVQGNPTRDRPQLRLDTSAS